MPSDKSGREHHCFKDRVGLKVGKLEILEYVGFITTPSGKRDVVWNCRCECGTEKPMRWHSSLSSGRKDASCGCVLRAVSSRIIKAYNATNPPSHTKTHGKTGTPEYISWQAMKARCNNKNSNEYCRYGGRGIKVCEEWVGSFESFLRDMGNKPTKSHSIDRINSNGNYCPDNCRWATPKEQARNTRQTRHITLGGSTKSLAEWVELTGLRPYTILYRINAGWSDVEITGTPPWGKGKNGQEVLNVAT